MLTSATVITQTQKWINEVVIGCNFCPFAAAVVKQQKIFYAVEESTLVATCLDSFLQTVKKMNTNESIETSLVIFPNAVPVFEDYLDMVTVAEKLLKQYKYEGIYQVASFHPLYLFAGSTEADAANYTNRSVYPMLHLLRESSIDKALRSYKNPDDIPAANIDFARKKGLVYMQLLRDACKQ